MSTSISRFSLKKDFTNLGFEQDTNFLLKGLSCLCFTPHTRHHSLFLTLHLQYQLSCIFIPTKRMIIYGRPLGAKWNTAASVCLGFSSWCKIFSTVPLHVSPSTHLTCLIYALTILNFCRSSRRLPVPFATHHSCFCTSCIVSAAFTTRTHII